jgi:hypothetical protein
MKSTLNNNASLSGLSIFPVPCNNVIYIETTLLKNSDVKIEILNGVGTLNLATIYNDKPAGLFNESLSVSNLLPGVYIVKITVDGYSENLKIVKQ